MLKKILKKDVKIFGGVKTNPHLSIRKQTTTLTKKPARTMTQTTHATQTFATAAELWGKAPGSYGHYAIVIRIYTNTDDKPIDHTYTTTNVGLIDMLRDDDSDIVELAKERLINGGLRDYGVEKSTDFTYIY